jgi:indole-3-glycerol phosphate synthase
MKMLEDILAHKRRETEDRKACFPIARLERTLAFSTAPVSLRSYLQEIGRSGVVAEFKRRSPSLGAIAPYAQPGAVTRGYMQAGACALSVLTDECFFDGRNADMEEARRWNMCPILRKDFILEPYQVIEAKSIGADAVLLIAAALSHAEVRELSALANSLGMETLLEVHHTEDLAKLTEHVHLVGVNNRDLHTFRTDPLLALRIASALPADLPWVAESGIGTPEQGRRLLRAGYSGLLIGEAFMRTPFPDRACAAFVAGLKATSLLTPLPVEA